MAQVRIAGRNTQGVKIIRTGEDEHVVSVERLEGDADDAPDPEAGADTGEGAP